MTFDATHTLRFINLARAAIGLGSIDELPFADAVRADSAHCLIVAALGGNCLVGGGRTDDGPWVLTVFDPEASKAIAAATGLIENADDDIPLPDEITNVAVGFDHGWITPANTRYLSPGQLSFDDLALRLVPGLRQEAEPSRSAVPVAA